MKMSSESNMSAEQSMADASTSIQIQPESGMQISVSETSDDVPSKEIIAIDNEMSSEWNGTGGDSKDNAIRRVSHDTNMPQQVKHSDDDLPADHALTKDIPTDIPFAASQQADTSVHAEDAVQHLHTSSESEATAGLNTEDIVDLSQQILQHEQQQAQTTMDMSDVNLQLLSAQSKLIAASQSGSLDMEPSGFLAEDVFYAHPEHKIGERMEDMDWQDDDQIAWEEEERLKWEAEAEAKRQLSLNPGPCLRIWRFYH